MDDPREAPDRPLVHPSTRTGEVTLGVDPDAGPEVMLARVRAAQQRGAEPVGPLDEGGMATIEMVVDHGLQRCCARKVIKPHLMGRNRTVGWFIREAQITGQLDHPHIVPVHALGVGAGGELYFTMKLVEGVTFGQRVDMLPTGPIEASELYELLEVVVKVCDALALAHSRGVVHCDVKPSNVMVGDFGQVYLMDWGVARLVDTPELDLLGPAEPVASWIGEPATRGVSGTPAFMAPEQARGEAVDARTDVFAMGALLFYLLTRRAPYGAGDPRATIEEARAARCRAPAEVAPANRVPRALDRLVARAMAADPAERFPSVEALRVALQGFLRGDVPFETLRVPAGHVVLHEGDLADAAYIVRSGRLAVYRTVEGREVPVNTLGPGEVFGETAILTESTRSASVRALEETALAVVTRDVFEHELSAMRPWMGAVTRTLARRFRELTVRGDLRGGPVEVARELLLWLEARGAATADGRGLEAAWRPARDRLLGRMGVSEASLRAALDACPDLQVDVAADRLTVNDIAALRAALEP